MCRRRTSPGKRRKGPWVLWMHRRKRQQFQEHHTCRSLVSWIQSWELRDGAEGMWERMILPPWGLEFKTQSFSSWQCDGVDSRKMKYLFIYLGLQFPLMTVRESVTCVMPWDLLKCPALYAQICYEPKTVLKTKV